MTAETVPVAAPTRRDPGRLRTFLTTIRAVLTRELRWRMRGRRAFVIASVSVLLLGLLVFLVYQLLYDNAVSQARFQFFDQFNDGPFLSQVDPMEVQGISGSAAVRIGQAIFTAVFGVLTILVLLVAPALTSGVISSEKEKQTLELLVTTPVSTLGMLIAKLIGSLAYVLLLIIASVPLMSIAFAFGGVGPEDVLRAYAVIIAIAFGAGCLGLFLSALIGRTQIATVVSYLIVFTLVVGTGGLFTWLYANSVVSEQQDAVGVRRQGPEALLWLNPLMTEIDVMCAVMPFEGGFCSVTREVMVMPDGLDQPRDAFWPRSVLAFVLTGSGLVLLATQLISPSRGLRSRRRRRRAATAPTQAVT